MLTVQLVLLSAAALMAILFGIRYAAAREFMSYHAAVAGRSWAQLEPGVQAIILGMYRIMGAGFVTYGVALLWLLVPLQQKQPWAPWAVLTLSVAGLVPILYVTLWLRRIQPAARTPVGPAAAALVLALAGAGASLWV